MDDMFVVWLKDHVRLSKAKTTYHSYQNIIKGIQLWFKRLQSKEVTPAHARRLLVEWDKKGLKASTINSRRAIMVGLFSWAKRMGFTDHARIPFLRSQNSRKALRIWLLCLLPSYRNTSRSLRAS